MAQILVRNLDDALVEQLKQRAAENRRSLQAEVKNILEQSTFVNVQTARELATSIRSQFARRKMVDSVDLIREDRDR